MDILSLVPFVTKKEVENTDDDVVVYKNNKLAVAAAPQGVAVQVRSKKLTIGGKLYNIDPKQLIRMVKQVTQTIGEYKNQENPYAAYVVGALRKARADMVSDLEHHFGIHWEINESTGKSVFYI